MRSTRRNTNKGNKAKSLRNSKNNSLKVKEKQLALTLVKSYPRQVVWEVTLPATPTKLTTTVTTGLISATAQVSSAALAAFATRFGSTFVEYRIIRARYLLRCFSSTNPGVFTCWFDEKSTAAPIVQEAQERSIGTFSCSSISTPHIFKWEASDTLDLQYQLISTAVTPVTFKVYTNNANFGASVVATDYLEIVPYFCVQFRGLQGV
jgi:hypothetical protein